MIMQEPCLLTIWMTLPHDMMILVCHVVGSLNLINELRYEKKFVLNSSTKDGDPPHPTPPPPSPPLPRVKQPPSDPLLTPDQPPSMPLAPN